MSYYLTIEDKKVADNAEEFNSSLINELEVMSNNNKHNPYDKRFRFANASGSADEVFKLLAAGKISDARAKKELNKLTKEIPNKIKTKFPTLNRVEKAEELIKKELNRISHKNPKPSSPV